MINNNNYKGSMMKEAKKFHKRWLGFGNVHNPLESISKMTLGILFYLIVIILSPLLITWIIIAKRNWNGGVCKKCGVGKHILCDYNSDRIRQNIYECSDCSNKFKSIIDYNEISYTELKAKIRENKLKRVGI